MKRLYYASFLPGLEMPMEQLLKKTGGISVERVLEGGALFRCNRMPVLPYVRQFFLVLFQMKPCTLPDEALRRLLTAGEWLNSFPYEEISGKHFRITISDGEKKIPASMRYVSLLEKAIEEQTGMHVNRERPDLELWVLLRREASYFLMRFLNGETNAKGRLRSDVAGAMAMQLGYNPGTVALLGTADVGLIRMLREQGARRIFSFPMGSLDVSFCKQMGVRALVGTPEHTDLETGTCDGICLFLPAHKSGIAAFDLRASLHECARLIRQQGILVLLAPQSEALETAERNREFRIEERYFCEWGSNRMLILNMRRVTKEA